MAKSKAPKAAKPLTSRERIEAYGLEQLITDLEGGQYLRHIAKDLGVPVMTLHDWIEADPVRSGACARAREEGAAHWDMESGRVVENAIDAFSLAKARELAIHYRWRAKAIAPRKYGDKQTIDLDAKIKSKRADEYTDDELAAMLPALVAAKAQQ